MVFNGAVNGFMDISTSKMSSEADSKSFSTERRHLTKSLIKVEEQLDCIELDCTQVCDISCVETHSEDILKKKSFYCSTICQSTWGVFLVIYGLVSFFYTPLDLMLREKLNMRPGLPPYEWWSNPPDEVILRVYVFNVTNHERFIEGIDKKLHYEEIGPIVYLEKLIHYDVVFNENSTMTYTAKRAAIFLPEQNTVDLNSTIIAPNLAILGMASYLHKSPFFVRSAFRFLVNSHGSQFFLQRSIYEYLWDYKEPVLETSKSLVPGLVPVTNMGMLSRIYSNFTDQLTVNIGPKWGPRGFFQITRVDGHSEIPGFDPEECPDRIYGASEGVMYQHHLQQNDILYYWRKTVCKVMPLYFDSELIVDRVPVYRYNLSESIYERLKNGTDCYDTQPPLQSGLSDASKCYFGFPMVVSYPHFYTEMPPSDLYVTGMKPDRDKHNSYVIVEPLSGTPFRQVARMQSNLQIHDLAGFSKEYDKFSNLILPLFWGEYSQEGLPGYISGTIYFMVVILPPLSIILSSLSLVFGCYLILKPAYGSYIHNESLTSFLPLNKRKVKDIAKNTIFSYEKQAFIKNK